MLTTNRNGYADRKGIRYIILIQSLSLILYSKYLTDNYLHTYKLLLYQRFYCASLSDFTASRIRYFS